MPSVPQQLRDELRRAIPLLIVLPIVVLANWGLGVLVIHSRVDSWDLRNIEWLVLNRTAWLNTATSLATYIAETIPVIVILLLAIVLARRWTNHWRTPVFLAAAVGGEKLIYLASSLLVSRDRPPVPTLDTTYATLSFPSGHVASAVTLYGAIAIAVGVWKGRRAFIFLTLLTVVLATIVTIARMYRGFHYPSDCIAGALLGAVWLALTYAVIRPLAVGSEPEVSGCLVDSAAFKAVGTSDPRPAGSIPVHLR